MGNPERKEKLVESRAVLVDVDNTINNLQVDLMRYVNRRLPQPYSYRRFTSADMESTDTLFDQFAAEFFNSPALLMKSKPFPGALDGIRLLDEKGFEIHIASGRHGSMHQTTMNWLEKHRFLPYVTFIHPRPAGESVLDFKIGIAKKVDAAVAFDDTRAVAEALSSNGIAVNLIRRPWNKEVRKSELIRPYPSFYRAVLAFVNSKHTQPNQT